MAAATCAAVWVMLRVAGDFRRALVAMDHFDAGWLALAATCELAGLLLTGEALWRLQGRPAVVARPVAQAASLVNLSLGAIMPAAPVEGFTLSFLELRRRGLNRRRAGLALAWGQWFQARAFVWVGAASALAVVVFGELTGRLAELALWGVGGGVAFLAGTWLLTKRPRPIAALSAALARVLPLRIRPDDARQLVQHLHSEAHELLGRGRRRKISWLFATVGPFATGVSLWLVLEAGGHPITIEEALLSGVVATASSWVPFVPGGIGVVESTLTVVLHHFGVPVTEGLAVALMWRVMTLIAPAATGLLALAGLRFRRSSRQPAGG